MEPIKQCWIILLMFCIVQGAVISKIQNTSYLIPCEDGWYLFGDKCYAIFEITKGLTWEAAEVSCERKHGSLVTIQRKELQDFLTAFLLLEVDVKWTNAWIGLNDRQEESNYRWVDGSALNYTYWGSGEPSSSQFIRRHYQEDDCVEMRTQWGSSSNNKVGMWNDFNCDKSQPFICQKDKSEQSMNNDPRFCTGKNEGAWRYMNSCYHTVSEEMSWDDAENYCQTVLDGHLLAIIDSNVDYFINYVLSDFNKEFWIGIKIRDSDYQTWSAAWVVNFKKWKPEQKQFINGTCAYMTEKRFWFSAPCFRKLPFVCEVPHVKPPPLKQAPEGWKCPELSQDWKDLGGDTCYIFETRKPKMWYEANFACFKKGGHLATISSLAEASAIHPHVLGLSEEMLIGLHRSLSNNSVFEWADGTVSDYQNWKFGEPNDHADHNEACVQIWPEDMKWNDIPCSQRHAYMCSAKKVPPYLFGKNESDLIDNQQLVERNCSCSGDGSPNAILTAFLVAVIVILVAVFTIYVYKNYFRKNNYQGSKYFAMSFSAENRPESNDLTQEEPIYKI